MATSGNESLERFRKDSLVTVDAETRVDEAHQLVREEGVHHLPVMRQGELSGMICSCDLGFFGGETPVGEIAHEPLTLSFQHTMDDALELMRECGVGSVLLLEGEQPVGIVTRGDLLHGGTGMNQTAQDFCACCGATAHLRSSAAGKTLCVDCRKSPRRRKLSRPPVRNVSSAE